MRIHKLALLAAGVVMLVKMPLCAADDVRAIIDKSIKAHGGEEKLAKLKAVTMRFKGTVHQMGTDFSFTGEVVVQGIDQSRLALDADMNGMKVAFVQVLNRDKGWTKINDTVEEMKPDQLAEAKEGAYHDFLIMLAPLKDKAFTLSSLGEVKVEDRPALGVRVSSKGHRDVNLYFDKETNLLVKTEMRVKDEQSGMEVSQEDIYGDYKEINGIKEATKIVVKKDGKPFVEGTVQEIKREEKLDDIIFSKP